MRRFFILLGTLLAQTAHAQSPYERYCAALGSYCGSGREFVIQLAQRIELLVVQFIGGIAVIAVIYGGLRMLFSGIDEGGRDEGKKIIQTALVGLVLALLAHSIVLFVADFVTGVTG